MDQNAIHRIDELMKQKRWDEAQVLLEELFASDVMTDESRGRSFISYVMAYMEALIDINQQYKSALEDATMLLKTVDANGARIKDDIDLARLKSEIGKLDL
jgi:ribosome-interacting GTPase 1